MTVWRHAVSWSKFKLALECPRQLQYACDKTPHGNYAPSYWATLGTMVQFVFEIYLNQRVNMRPGGDNKSVVMKVAEKVLASPKFTETVVNYPQGKTEEELKNDIRSQVSKGYDILKKMGVTTKPFDSEKKWNSVFRDFRMFAMIDFFLDQPTARLYDGKGNREMDADERQILYYALAVSASGRTIKDAGLIYWNYDYKPVDVSPKAIKEFIDGDFAEGKPYFDKLKKGLEPGELLEARPSSKTCGWCNWRHICPASAKLRPSMDTSLPEDAGFGE